MKCNWQYYGEDGIIMRCKWGNLEDKALFDCEYAITGDDGHNISLSWFWPLVELYMGWDSLLLYWSLSLFCVFLTYMPWPLFAFIINLAHFGFLFCLYAWSFIMANLVVVGILIFEMLPPWVSLRRQWPILCWLMTVVVSIPLSDY